MHGATEWVQAKESAYNKFSYAKKWKNLNRIYQCRMPCGSNVNDGNVFNPPFPGPDSTLHIDFCTFFCVIESLARHPLKIPFIFRMIEIVFSFDAKRSRQKCSGSFIIGFTSDEFISLCLPCAQSHTRSHIQFIEISANFGLSPVKICCCAM